MLLMIYIYLCPVKLISADQMNDSNYFTVSYNLSGNVNIFILLIGGEMACTLIQKINLPIS